MDYIKNIIKDKLLLSNFLSSLFCSISYPTIHVLLMSNINSQLVSLNSVIVCLAGIILPILWNKYSEKLYKYFIYFSVLEVIVYILLIFMVITKAISYKLYYILDFVSVAIISKNIMCSNNILKAKRYNDLDKRTTYDNNISIVVNSSCLLGFISNYMFSPSSNIAFVFLVFGIAIDNIFYCQVYKEVNNKNKKGGFKNV